MPININETCDKPNKKKQKLNTNITGYFGESLVAGYIPIISKPPHCDGFFGQCLIKK